MKMTASITKVATDELPECLEVIHRSFATVADDFSLTEENCPRHTSFIPLSHLETQMKRGWIMFGLFFDNRIIGYMSLSEENDKAYELHNLAILPKFRHLGFGKQMLDYAKITVKALCGSKITIGIIEESTVLKSWYITNGFEHIGTKKFDHLPFTCGYLEWKNDIQNS